MGGAYELITGLRATRWFTGESVTKDEVAEIVEAARWTGSARNRQPWRFGAVWGSALKARLAGLGRYAQPLAGAPVVLVLLSDASAGTDTEFDLGRVCQSLLLAAHAKGLGSCPVTLHPETNAVEAARLVGFVPPWQARHAVALGWPAVGVAGRSAVPTGRKALEELLTHLD